MRKSIKSFLPNITPSITSALSPQLSIPDQSQSNALCASTNGPCIGIGEERDDIWIARPEHSHTFGLTFKNC
jgi:hypothetical protein